MEEQKISCDQSKLVQLKRQALIIKILFTLAMVIGFGSFVMLLVENIPEWLIYSMWAVFVIIGVLFLFLFKFTKHPKCPNCSKPFYMAEGWIRFIHTVNLIETCCFHCHFNYKTERIDY